MKPPIVRRQAELAPVPASDGAEVIELFGVQCPGIKHMSLATGSLPPRRKAKAHYHQRSEEIYYIVSGRGIVRIEERTYRVKQGDAVGIPKRHAHSLENTSRKRPLIVLCVASPPFEESDLYLV